MDSVPIRGVIWLIGLVILNAIVEAMVTAFENANEPVAEKRAEEGDKKAKLVAYLLNHHRCYITVTDLIRILALAGITLAYADGIFATIVSFIREKITAQEGLVVLLTTLVTILIVLFVELFGIKIPKKVAYKHADGFAYFSAKLLRFFTIIFGPFAWVLETLTFGILKLFNFKASELEEMVTEEELISTVAEAQESGVLEAEEAEMIHNIFEFDAKEVNDIMTHRKNMVAVDAEMTIEEAMKFMVGEVYSRFPVYEESVENIIGVLHMKDVIRMYISGNADKIKQKKVRNVARKPYFVPDTQSIDVLFHDMQKKKIHMAFAIDEYGQTAGLVTMEDILEEIVGDIQDEYDSEDDDIISEREDVYLVKGVTSLEDISEVLELDMTDEDFDTLNGLMVSELGHIPVDGEKFEMTYHNCRMEIVEVKNKMIALARIQKLPTEEKSEDIEEK